MFGEWLTPRKLAVVVVVDWHRANVERRGKPSTWFECLIRKPVWFTIGSGQISSGWVRLKPFLQLVKDPPRTLELVSIHGPQHWKSIKFPQWTRTIFDISPICELFDMKSMQILRKNLRSLNFLFADCWHLLESCKNHFEGSFQKVIFVIQVCHLFNLKFSSLKRYQCN